MSIIDQLPHGEPVRLLHELEQMSREIKSPQTFGSTSVATSLIQSADAYDLEWPAGDTHQGLITFTPDDMTFGGALVYRVYAVSVGLMFTSEYYVYALRVDADNIQRFRIPINNFGSLSPMRMKFYFFTAGTGTFTTNLV